MAFNHGMKVRVLQGVPICSLSSMAELPPPKRNMCVRFVQAVPMQMSYNGSTIPCQGMRTGPIPVICSMRLSYMGIIPRFQRGEPGSNPGERSKKSIA